MTYFRYTLEATLMEMLAWGQSSIFLPNICVFLGNIIISLWKKHDFIHLKKCEYFQDIRN